VAVPEAGSHNQTFAVNYRPAARDFDGRAWPETEVDCPRGALSGFHMRAIAEDQRSVKANRGSEQY
jgi:hypothetical protein